MPNDEPWSAVTESLLVDLAGPAAYKRGLGYHRDGNVIDMEWVNESTIRATVAGTTRYVTQLTTDDESVDAACTCPVGDRGEFCKHAVAVALQLIDPADDEPPPAPRTKSKRPAATRRDPEAELRAELQRAPMELLIDLVTERALDDPPWHDHLLAKLSGSGGAAPDPARYKAMLQSAMRVSGFLDWRQVSDWAGRAYDAIQSLEDLIEQRPRDAVKLAEYALKRCDTVYQRIDDSGGEISMLIACAESIHREASPLAGEDPVKLATRLYGIETESELDILHNAYTTHAEALGETGRQHYRSLATQDWLQLRDKEDSDDWELRSRRRRVASILEQVARADRDIDAIVEYVGDGFHHSWRYVQVASACMDIDELDAAVEWCERGIAEAPDDHRIHDMLVQVRLRRDEPKLAIAPAWTMFERTCSPQEFERLRSCAEPARVWKTWRKRAFDHTRTTALGTDTDATRLVELHLHEHELDEAWKVAARHGCDQRVLLRLAERRETAHPVDSARVYLGHIDAVLETNSKRRYDETVALLSRANALLASDDERTLFDTAIERLRDEHRRKRTLMAKLDTRGW
jgi:hypothetical protein